MAQDPKLNYENILRGSTYEQVRPQDSLCELRWSQPTIDLSKGEVRVCCRVPSYKIPAQEIEKSGTDAILNNSYFRERRQEMFQGIRHKDCAPCWKAENSKQPSPRTGADKILNDLHAMDPALVKKGIGNITAEHPVMFAKSIPFLEVQLGNLCDLKCVYCWRGNSSRWAQEDLQFGRITQSEFESFNSVSTINFTDTYWKWFETVAANLQMLSFVGGEPTLNENFHHLVLKTHQILKSKGNSTCRLRMVTNLNCGELKLNELLSVVSELNQDKRKILIDVSMEAFGTRAEKIRHGLIWQNFEKNLIRILDGNFSNVNLAFSATINALSITSFENFVDFLAPIRKQYRVALPFLENSVIDPIWLAPEVLTPDFKEYLLSTGEKLRIHESDHSYQRPDPTWGYNWKRYSEYIFKLANSIHYTADTSHQQIQWTRGRFALGLRELEARRRFQFKDIFPEMTSFIALCNQLETSYQYRNTFNKNL